jgi:hypothetical protein
MKNKLLAIMAIFGMVASASAVKINNNLSINGFIDGSYAVTEAAAKTQSLEIDEVEVNFVLNVGNVSGLIALDSDISNDGTPGNEGTPGTPGIGIEQAHFTYNINDAVSATFGRYGAALGFEREDPAGLYTYSRAYSEDAFNLGNVDANVVEGLTLAYSGDAYSIAVSLENQAGSEADLQDNDLDFEISFTYTGIAGVNIGGGVFLDNEAAGDGLSTDGAETDAVNVHISRQFGKLLLAGEYTQLDTTPNGSTATEEERDAYLILADYDVNDKLGVALRLSSNEKVNAGGDYDKFTIAPNYAITESLGAILEFSDIDDAGTDSEEYAVELTYTF